MYELTGSYNALFWYGFINLYYCFFTGTRHHTMTGSIMLIRNDILGTHGLCLEPHLQVTPQMRMHHRRDPFQRLNADQFPHGS